MIKNKKLKICSMICASILCFISLAYSQTISQDAQRHSIVSVVGRMTLEKHGQEDWLVLHAKNAETYLMTGGLINDLKNSLLELGQFNLIFVTGNQDGRSSVTCEQSNEYEYNKKGEKVLKTSTKCIRYYNLEVTQILSAKKSNDKIPDPKRDVEEEQRMITSGASQQGKNLVPTITGEIYGVITDTNSQSVFNTITITNRDKNNPLNKITLIVSDSTRIAKKIGEEEPMAMTKKALKSGQEVTAVYQINELKNQALFITITKE